MHHPKNPTATQRQDKGDIDMLREFATEIEEARYRVVHEYISMTGVKGAQGLAPLLGKNPAVLCHKVDPQKDTHHLTADEEHQIEMVTGDLRITHARLAELGLAAVKLGDFEDTSDTELLDLQLRMNKEVGEASAALMRAIADGTITPAEAREFEKETFEGIRAMLELNHRIAALADFNDSNHREDC